MEKYDFSEQDANDMADFLVPILDFVPEKRPTAAQCLTHPWISGGPQLLQPSSVETPSVDGISDKKKMEKDEREAMEVGMGNIVIDGASKSFTDPQPSNRPNKASLNASR